MFVCDQLVTLDLRISLQVISRHTGCAFRLEIKLGTALNFREEFCESFLPLSSLCLIIHTYAVYKYIRIIFFWLVHPLVHLLPTQGRARGARVRIFSLQRLDGQKQRSMQNSFGSQWSHNILRVSGIWARKKIIQVLYNNRYVWRYQGFIYTYVHPYSVHV